MNEEDKRSYLERYKAAKEKGVPFFPDVVFKDVVHFLPKVTLDRWNIAWITSTQHDHILICRKCIAQIIH